MNQEEWKIIQSLFLDARELPAEEREEFLAVSKASPEAIVHVLKMIAADQSATGYAEPPSASDLARTISPDSYLKGTTLGDFKLFEEIGRGGMGIVYRAHQISLNRDVAVKVLPPALAASNLRLARFHREALAASKLDHPGVAPVLAFGEEGGIVFYAMKLIDGPTLQEVLQRARKGEAQTKGIKLPVPKDPKSCSAFMRKLLMGLAHVHDHSILHRDVKPANILCGDDLPTLIDFGLAKDLELTGLTGTGDIGGSPYYMSPEQIVSLTAGIDSRTDIYSAGAILYELLTLQPPFAGTGVSEIFRKIQEEMPKSPRKLNPNIPKALELIVLKALEKDATQRYPSAREMSDDLERFEKGDAVKARPVSMGRRARTTAVKRRSLLKIGPALLIGGAILGTLAYQQSYGPEALAKEAWPHVTFMAPTEEGAKVYGIAVSVPPEVLGEKRLLGKIGDDGKGRLYLRLEAGQYRFIVQSKGLRQAELLRDLLPDSESTLTPRLAPVLTPLDQMVRIEGGTVTLTNAGLTAMGAVPKTEAVIVVEPFLLDQSTVTNGQYWDYLKESGSPIPLRWQPKEGKDTSYSKMFEAPPRPDWRHLPAVLLTWQEASMYAEYYSKRLATEAELTLVCSRAIADLADLSIEQQGEKTNFAATGDFTPRRTLGTYIEHVRPSRDVDAELNADRLYHPVGNIAEWTASKTSFPGTPNGRISIGMDFSMQLPTSLAPGGPTPLGMSDPTIGFRCAKSILTAE